MYTIDNWTENRKMVLISINDHHVTENGNFVLYYDFDDETFYFVKLEDYENLADADFSIIFDVHKGTEIYDELYEMYKEFFELFDE